MVKNTLAVVMATARWRIEGWLRGWVASLGNAKPQSPQNHFSVRWPDFTNRFLFRQKDSKSGGVPIRCDDGMGMQPMGSSQNGKIFSSRRKNIMPPEPKKMGTNFALRMERSLCHQRRVANALSTLLLDSCEEWHWQRRGAAGQGQQRLTPMPIPCSYVLLLRYKAYHRCAPLHPSHAAHTSESYERSAIAGWIGRNESGGGAMH